MKKANKVINYMLLMGILAILVNLSVECQRPLVFAAEGKVVSMLDETHAYTFIGRPDPFEPFIEREIILVEKLKKRREQTRVVSASPLQRGAIRQFKLIGIIGDERQKIAMVEDTNRKFYPLFIGSVIGESKGKVVQILSDRIFVEETVQMQKGKTRVNRVMLKLHTDR